MSRKIWLDVACKVLVEVQSDSADQVAIQESKKAVRVIFLNDIDGIEYEGCTIEEVENVTCEYSDIIK